MTREDVQILVDRLRKTQPSLVGEVVGELVPIGTLQRVLKNLLTNAIPVRELTTILEALGEHASKTKNTDVLTEMVRKHLSRTITEQYKDDNGKIQAITLEPAIEHMDFRPASKDKSTREKGRVKRGIPLPDCSSVARETTETGGISPSSSSPHNMSIHR